MTLPAHEVRCLDPSCPKRAQCHRFLDRATGTDATTGYIATCWQHTAAEPEKVYPQFCAVAPAPEALQS